MWCKSSGRTRVPISCFQKGILIKGASSFPPTETETSRIRETCSPALNADMFSFLSLIFCCGSTPRRFQPSEVRLHPHYGDQTQEILGFFSSVGLRYVLLQQVCSAVADSLIFISCS